MGFNMIDESQIEYLLDGERAEADVLNRPLRQVVRATNANFAASADDTAALIEERLNDVFEVIKDGNGFTREKDAQLIFDAENATVTIAPGLGKSTWFYYHKGRKIESSETLTYTLSETDKVGGGFYLSFDKDRNFVNTGQHPDFFNTTLCFYVYYSNGEFIIEGDERHAADRDTAWHESHHREDGMVVYIIGDIAWTPDDADNVGIQITNSLVADEDLHHLIKHSPTGEEPFSQILEGSQDEIRIPTLCYDGGIRYLADKKLPWVTDALKYNDGDTLKDVPNSKFVNYFLVATNCQKYPIKLIMGRTLFDSDHETVDETLESLGLNFPEMAMLYRIVLKRNNSLSTVGKCTITSIQQAASRITFESATNTGGSSVYNHSRLLGRTEDNAHPVSSITGLQEDLDSKVDKVTGKELSANDFTNVLKTKLDSLPSGVSGVIPISGGGTGATTAPDARTALGLGDEATRWPTFAEVTDKPTTYAPSAHTHPWAQVTGQPATATRWPTFTEVTGKPANYPTTWNSVGAKPVQATRWPTFTEVTDKPTNYPTTWNSVAAKPAQATRWPTFAEVTDKPSTFKPSSHTHPWTQVTGQPVTATRWPTYDEVTDKPTNYPTTWGSVAAKPAQATRWPSWMEVSGKPTSFTPASHTHPWAQVTGQPVTATRWPTWAEVTGKPTTFTATAHTHPVSQVTGLGTAATRDVGTASGNVMEVGAFGLGKGQQSVPTLEDANLRAGLYTSTDGIPVSNPCQALVIPYRLESEGSAFSTHLIMSHDVDRFWFRRLRAGVFQPPVEIHHSGNFNPATKANTSTQVIAGTGLTGGGTLAANRTLNVSYGTAAGTAAQGNDSRIVNAVPNSRTITAGTGLSGGGTLAANRTLAVSYGTAAGTAAQGNDSRITGAFQKSQVVQATGTSTTSVMSQKATTDQLATKAASSHTHPWAQVTGQPATATRWPTWAEVTSKPVVQTTGQSTTNIMSQKAVTDALSSAGTPGIPDKNNILFDKTVKAVVEFDHLSISKTGGHAIPETSATSSTYLFPGGMSCKSPNSSGVRTYYTPKGISIGSSTINLVEFNSVGGKHSADFKGTVHVAGGIKSYESSGSESYMWSKNGFRVTPTEGNVIANIASNGVASFVDVNITSDERYKSNKRKITNPIDKVNALSGYNYTLHSEIGGDVVGESAGILAQDVEKIMPECVTDTDGKLSVSYSGITALLVETVKDMNARIIELEKTIEMMR